MLPDLFLAGFKDVIEAHHRFVIISHKNPDGDALGASLAMKEFLIRNNKTAYFISPTFFTDGLAWMPYAHQTVVFEDYKTKTHATNVLASATCIICLDFNAISRLDELGKLVSQSTAYKVMIDHHQQPEDFADLMWSDTSYGATCEMVFELFDTLTDYKTLPHTLATNLYTGIATDTGFFQFSNTTPRVHLFIAKLIEIGASPDFVADMINSTFREIRLKYFGYALYQKLKIVNDGKVAYIFMSEKEQREFDVQLGENETLVNFPFKIKGVKVSVFFSEEKGLIKISFRSKENIDMSHFARTYFEGGGHINASGGKSLLSIEETEKKFLSLLPDLFINEK